MTISGLAIPQITTGTRGETKPLVYSRALHFEQILEEQGFLEDQKAKLRFLFRKVQRAFLKYRIANNNKNQNFPNYHLILSWLCNTLGYSYSFLLKSRVKMEGYSALWKELQIIIDEDQSIDDSISKNHNSIGFCVDL